MKKYCLTKSKQSRNISWETVNNWYWRCMKYQVPYIHIEQRVSLSDIRWDYITYRARMDDAFDKQQGEKLSSEAMEMFSEMMRASNNTRAKCNANGWTIVFYDVPNSLAEGVAKELFNLISRHCRDYLASGIPV